MMKKEKDLDFEKLIDWIEGRLADAEMQRVAAQITEADETVQADIAWLRKFFRASQNVVFSEPPTAVIQSLERQFATHTRRRHPPTGWQRFIATLSFDSHADLALGLRAVAAPEEQRQLIFETAVATIICTLQQRGRSSSTDLLGQILPAAEDELEMYQVQVQLFQENNPLEAAISNDLGEFSFPALPPGLYNLTLNSSQYEIVVSSLDLTG